MNAQLLAAARERNRRRLAGEIKVPVRGQERHRANRYGPDALAESLTTAELRETCRAIFKAIHDCPDIGPSAALSAIAESVHAAIVWAEETREAA